jgi:hypothetical protein
MVKWLIAIPSYPLPFGSNALSLSLNQLSGRELSVRVASRREVETRQQRYFFMRNHLNPLKSQFCRR